MRAARASVVTVTLNPLGKRVGDYCTGRGAIAPREPLQIYNLDIGRFEVLSDEPAADASETARADFMSAGCTPLGQDPVRGLEMFEERSGVTEAATR